MALFGISSALHLFQMIKLRTWYFVPFLIGCCFEIIGYIGRALSATETPKWSTTSYKIQSLTLLLGPALLAASIYMVLGRLIRFLKAEYLALIGTKWLTKLFVLGDVISFVTQGVGGAILSRAKSLFDVELGENIIIAGLTVQILFFGGFIIVTCLFHYFADYETGSNGALMVSEVYIYVFDAALMFLVAAVLNMFHPGTIVQMENRLTAISESSVPLDLQTFT
ncbi:RTA1 like protein-domain-containing protein [Colletotrichum godetiae]|uniref:RTA1 like protein-domain-containing protein n=1 Tax=Colletotrichum godetiae TaxID=1209918 RepID=A0AAJ0EUM5_9PEZI|nr:RTA1 like protein-domain-containing protein [Colletotrichum godetiae]KAK1672354.1 RTA1 like protein-domain-containing protein [Colletotrichum godetiae]